MTLPRELTDAVTVEAGAVHEVRTSWVGATHYNYRVVGCPPEIRYGGAFTQVFNGGHDYITSTLTVMRDAVPGVYPVIVEWRWSNQPITFRDILYTLRLRLEVHVEKRRRF